MEDSIGLKISQEEFKNITSSFSLDLIAYFSLIEEEINILLENISNKEITPEQFIQKVEGLL